MTRRADRTRRLRQCSRPSKGRSRSSTRTSRARRSYELLELVNAAPALVSAADGTTNALALEDARDFQPLYGPGSADRFGLKQLYLPGLCQDVDTEEDLLRLAPYVGCNTRSALLVHTHA